MKATRETVSAHIMRSEISLQKKRAKTKSVEAHIKVPKTGSKSWNVRCGAQFSSKASSKT